MDAATAMRWGSVRRAESASWRAPEEKSVWRVVRAAVREVWKWGALGKGRRGDFGFSIVLFDNL